MKKLAITAAILIMAATPSFAQFPQVDGDPINYSLIRYPHLPGSYPVSMEVELNMLGESTAKELRAQAKGEGSFTLHYDGELIRTKEVSEKMLKNAINWAFNESGIRDRRHLQQLIHQVNVVLPRDAQDLFWEQMGFNAIDFMNNVGNMVSDMPMAGRVAMGGKYVVKILDVASGRSDVSQAFLNSGTVADATSIGLEMAGAAASVAEGVNLGFFLFDFWNTFFDEYYQASVVKPQRTAAAYAAQMINKFYAAANKYIKDHFDYLDEEKWMIYFKGKATHPFEFNDELCTMSLEMEGTLDKLFPIDDDRNDAYERFTGSIEGQYFGWVDAKQHCDMSNFDNNYLLFPHIVGSELSKVEVLMEKFVPSSPMRMRQAANMWQNTCRRYFLDGQKNLKFEHKTNKATASSARYSIPIILSIKAPEVYRNYASVDFRTLEGEDDIAGEHPEMKVENLRQSYDHEFTFAAKGLNLHQQEVLKGDKMMLISNGEVIEERDAKSVLIAPPHGNIVINFQQSIADGTVSKTK